VAKGKLPIRSWCMKQELFGHQEARDCRLRSIARARQTTRMPLLSLEALHLPKRAWTAVPPTPQWSRAQIATND